MTKLALLLAALPAVALAQTAHFDPARLSHHVEILSSDAFEGRAPATRAEPKVIDYIVGQLKAVGVQPGGQIRNGKRSWTQDVPLLHTAFVGAPSITLTSNGQPMPLTQGDQIALRAPLTGQKLLSLKDVPLVFVGYGVHAP